MKKAFKIAIISTLFAGCGSFNHVDRIETNNKSSLSATQQLIDQQKREPAKPIDPVVEYHDGPVVALKASRIRRSPDAQGGPWCKFNKLATSEPVTVLEFAQIVTRWCKIPVRVTPDAIEAIESGASRNTAAGVPGQPGSAGAPGVQQGMVSGNLTNLAAVQAVQSIVSRTVDISYSGGNLDGLMDVVTAKFGLSWKREDGHISIYNLDTQSFHVFAFDSKNDIVADSTAGTTMSGGTSGAGGSGSSGGSSMSGQTGTLQSTRVSIKTSIWDDIKSTVDTIKSPKGKCTVAPSTGTITCTDTGEGLRRIGAYVRQENINLTKQVYFHCRILSVTFKTQNGVGVSWAAVYEALKNKYSIKLASSFASLAGAAQGTFSVLDNSGSRWQGSDAVFSALSEFGTVSIVKEPSIPTLNLQAVPIQVANVDTYIPGSTTQTTASVGTSTSLSVATVTTGFAMTLLPYILPNGGDQMLLHFSLTLNSLDDIRKVTIGSAYAEAPIVSMPINSTQKVRLRSGQTLMMTGFDQNSQNSDRKGVGSPNFWLLGGGVNGNETRTALVVLITPVIDVGDVHQWR